jgi:hypothetical protein
VGNWKTRLEVLAAAAGTAVLIQFVGGAVIYMRFEDADIPAGQTVAALPKEFLFAVGARFIVPLALFGLLAVGFLLVLADRGEPQETEADKHDPPPPPALRESARLEQYSGQAGDKPPERAWQLLEPPAAPPPEEGPNPPGDLPNGFDRVLIALFAFFVVTAVVSDVRFLLTLVLIVLAALLLLGARFATMEATSIHAAAWTVFLMSVVFGTMIALARTVRVPVKLDIGAVERKKGTPYVGGFFLARTGESVYLVTRPERGTKGPQVTVIDNEDVTQLAYGPSGVEVNSAGFDRAERLAGGLDARPPKLTASVARTQPLSSRTITVTASCDERCSLRASGFLFGPRTRDTSLTPVTRDREPGATAQIELTRAGRTQIAEAARRDPRVQVRVRVSARDLAGNKTSATHLIRLED